jgi:hypothetical protein
MVSLENTILKRYSSSDISGRKFGKKLVEDDDILLSSLHAISHTKRRPFESDSSMVFILISLLLSIDRESVLADRALGTPYLDSDWRKSLSN